MLFSGKKLMFIDLPEPVREQTDDLGTPLLHCRTSAVQTTLYLVFGVLAIVLGLAGAVLCIVALTAPGAKTSGMLKLGVFVLAVLSSGVGMLAKWRNLRGASVIVFEGGLAKIQGPNCSTMPWREITTIRRGRPVGDNDLTIGTPMRLTLIDRGGQEWVLTESYTNLKELRTAAEECSLATMVPEALRTMQDGQTVSFGDIAASREGLTSAGKDLLEWAQVAEAKIEKGKVTISSRLLARPWYEGPIYQVPNAHLLLALVERGGAE
jgi:hypothetical protein